MSKLSRRAKPGQSMKGVFQRKTHGTLLSRIESYDSRRFKVTIRDMDGVLYWESKGVPRDQVMDLAGCALFVIERLPKSKREDLIVPGSKPVAITDQDWNDYLSYIQQGATREERSAV